MSSTCVCVHVSVCYWQVCCNSFLHIHPHVQRYINNGTEHCALFYCTYGPCSVAYSALFHLCLNFPFKHFYGDFIHGCNIDFNKIKQCSQSQQFLRAVLGLSKGTNGDVCTLDWLTCRFVSVEHWKPFTVQTVFGFISASLLYYLHSSGWLTHCCLWGWTSTNFMSLLNNLRKGMFYLVLLHACAVLLNKKQMGLANSWLSAAVLRFVQMWGQKKMWGGLWKNEQRPWNLTSQYFLLSLCKCTVLRHPGCHSCVNCGDIIMNHREGPVWPVLHNQCQSCSWIYTDIAQYMMNLGKDRNKWSIGYDTELSVLPPHTPPCIFTLSPDNTLYWWNCINQDVCNWSILLMFHSVDLWISNGHE